MCIIAMSETGVAPLTKEILKTCFENNKDGAGFTWYKPSEERWYIEKGFMTFDMFWPAYEAHNFTENDFVVCHFRIGTSGLMDGGNTHPFPMTASVDKMRLTRIKTDRVVIHNGVVGQGDGDASDTMVHIRDYIAPLYKYSGDPKIKNIMREYLKESSNRWVITNKDEVMMYGTWNEHDEGWQFSNWSWKPRVYTPPAKSWKNGNAGNRGVSRYQDEFYTNGNFDYGKWKKHQEEKAKAAIEASSVLTKDDKHAPADYKSPAEKARKAPAEDVQFHVKGGDVKYHQPTMEEAMVIGYVDSKNHVDWCNTTSEREDMSEERKPDKFLFCPECDSDDQFMDSPYNVGDTLCCTCGSVFVDATGEVVSVDDEMRASYLEALMKKEDERKAKEA